jgi:WD40 repeat protein
VSPDESFIWSGDTDGLICIWNIQTSRFVSSLKMEEPVNCIMQFGNYVWVGLYRSLYVFDCTTVTQVSRFDVNTVHDIVASNGKIWVACNDKIRVLDPSLCLRGCYWHLGHGGRFGHGGGSFCWGCFGGAGFMSDVI